MILVALLLALAGLASAQDVAAAPKNPTPNAARPKIGLALSGGGARGVSHVGVLKALEELRVPVDCIAGTSMGAVVGGFYASGLSPAEMEKWFRRADWHYLMADGFPRESESIRNKQRNFASNQGIPFRIRDDGVKLPAAFISGRNVMLTLSKLTVPVRDIHDFDRLPIPFRAVTTDIEKGELVVLREGDLVESMRASMSIPALFMPVKIGDRLLVDGGSSNNFPISIVQEMGAEVVIAVDVSEPLKKDQQLDTAATMALQVVNVLLKQQMKEEKARLGPEDVLIRVEQENMAAIDFAKAIEGIDEGYREAMKARASLERYSLSPAAYQQYLAHQRVPREPSVPITFLKVKTPKGEFDHGVQHPFDFQAGDEDAPAELQNLVNDLGEMQPYEVKDYRVIKKDGDYGLLVTARERKNGRHELTFGFDFGYSSADDGDYNLLIAHRMRELNAWGAEWNSYLRLGSTTRLDTEWYQPIDADRRFFVALRGMAGNDFVDGRDASGEPLRFRQEDYFIGADVGMRLWQAGEFRVGYGTGITELHRRLGVPPDEPTDADRGWLHADLVIDTLDAPNFSTQGIFGEVSVIASRHELGDSENYTRLAGQLYKPVTVGKNTIVPRIRGSVRLEGDRVPLYDQGSLGGFLNLSGLARGSLFGEDVALAELVYYRKIADLNPSTGRGLYAGFSAEVGEAWGHEKDFRWGDSVVGGSAFLGADTIMGGLYFGVGVAEGGDFSVYLQLGPLFGQGRHDR